MKKYVQSLGFFIAVAVLLGLSVPVVVALSVLTGMREKQIEVEIQSLIREKSQTLQHNLLIPVWNLDRYSMEAVLQAAMLDEQVVSITVQAPDKTTLAQSQSALYANRRLISQSAALNIQAAGRQQTIGTLTVVVTDALMQQRLQADKTLYGLVLLCQALASLMLIGWVVHARILSPLSRITGAAKRIQKGSFDNRILVHQRDEMGLLARRMEKMQDSLKSLFEEQAAILDNVPAGVLFIRHGIIEFVNQAGRQLLSRDGLELTGRSIRQHLAEAGNDPTPGPGAGQTVHMTRTDGSTFPAEWHAAAVGTASLDEQAIWVVMDITERLEAESRIDRLAFYDPATQLPNRNLMLDRLRHALSSQAADDDHTAVLCLEVHNADLHQGTIEADKADALYADCAQRINACVEQHQTVARLDGSKFAVLCETRTLSLEEAVKSCESLAQTLLSAFSAHKTSGASRHPCLLNLGINILGQHPPSAEEALMQAELAMVQAKAVGRNTFRFFNPDMQALATQRSLVEADLRQAIEHRQFVVFYQAQVDQDGQVQGAEALIRWRHPTKGMVSPALFIQIAEDAGLMREIGQIVLDQVCQDLARWQAAGLSDRLVIAVNVSAQEFASETFVSDFCAVLQRHGIDSQRLKVELTESMMVEKIDAMTARMHALKAQGIAISLDDFGTGYSSLAYLSRFPIDQIKIDQSFVREMQQDSNQASITRAIITLGESLGLSILAEGVETREQRDMLLAMGCASYQGYWYSRPIPEQDFAALVQKRLPCVD
jgi:diguanylate cyclase (GGDEF)-like protein/PAS domain S-box-containing protein